MVNEVYPSVTEEQFGAEIEHLYKFTVQVKCRKLWHPEVFVSSPTVGECKKYKVLLLNMIGFEYLSASGCLAFD